MSANATTWRPRVNPWIIATSVMLATFMEVLDTSVANVALPHIAGNLSASTDEATWVLTSYLVANAIILPATGWFSNRFGRKRFLIVCIVIFTISSVLCGAAGSLGFLVLARILQGAGGGALQPIAQAVLLESFPPEKRGSAMAVYGLGVVVAPIIGPTLGGWITDSYSWRWIFYINLPIGAAAIAMVSAFVDDPDYIKNAARGAIDYVGFGLMAVWLATLQIVLDKGQEEDWFETSWIVWFTVVSVISMVAFIVWELRGKSPIVNLRVFLNRNFAIGTALVGAVGIVLFGTTALLPLFLQTLMGYPALQSGLATSPRGFGSVVAMLVVGRLIGKIDERWLLVFGFGVLGFATMLMGNLTLDVSMGSVIVPNMLMGLSLGFIFVPLTTIAMGTLRNEQVGNAAGLYNLVRNLGGGVGISIVATMLSRYSQAHQAQMVGHLSTTDPEFQQRLATLVHAFAAQMSPVDAMQRAQAILYGTLVTQAHLWAYVDTFRLLAGLSLLAIPLVFLLKRVRARGGPVAAH
jgi:MFS transporter, DHA2 family, multidrug resistance protein